VADWTGEYEGVVVKSPEGNVLGVFNTEDFLKGHEEGMTSIKEANFALGGHSGLVLMSVYWLWTVKLSEVLVGPGRLEL
jgi:gluconolactonase